MFLALRELKYSKGRYGLIGLIMVLVAWLTFIVSGLANGLSSDNASILKNMDADYFVLQSDSEHKLTRSALPVEKLDEVRQLNGDIQAEPLSQTMLSVYQTGSNKKIDIAVFAIEPEGTLMPSITEGQNMAANDEIVVDSSLKEKGIKLGDTIGDKDLGIEWKVVGFTKNQKFSHTPVVFMDIQYFSDLMQASMGKKVASYNSIVIKSDSVNKDTLQKNLTDAEVITKQEAVQGIPGFKEEQGSLTMMIAFLIVIAAFIQAVFFYVITLQKISQFGVLKAIGAKTSYLATNLVGQVLLLAIVAVAISIGLTFGVSAILPESMPFELGTDILSQYSGLLILVSIIGALLSLNRIAKVDAIEAIGRVE
ncbi:putative ABC transport system permease protein [Paenibacillus castaneae]|uniref:ABC transporter permease n=1 Tax=Paenibacillus castaneae TaxID=474957 RepID=UPI000C9985D5|nr:ABC transporter permease [Paenibacillus castaneae]NIK76475.1 putative ABC transport system permease protein [Paenibacillus castaneae]